MEMTLEAFVESPPFKDVDNGQTRRISGLPPQVGGCSRAMLKQAKENLRKDFAVVGLTERFEETLLLLNRAFSWSRDVFYYPKNTNPGRTKINELPQRTTDAILERNEFDHDLYQFACELMDSAVSSCGADFQRELEEFKLNKQAWYERIVRHDADAKVAR